MIGLLIGLIVLCIVVYIFWYIINMVAAQFPPPIRMLITVVFALIVLIALLNYLPGFSLPRGRL
jgi:hypothetical protein